MKIPLLCVFILLISCNNEKKEDIFFSNDLYQEVLKYQQNNPIPTKSLFKLFIYEITFSKQKDTLVTITVSPTGVRSINSFGIYNDKNMKPTYVIDSQSVGEKFVKYYKKDSIKYYILEETPPHVDIIYPVYRYKIQRDKLVLIDSLK